MSGSDSLLFHELSRIKGNSHEHVVVERSRTLFCIEDTVRMLRASTESGAKDPEIRLELFSSGSISTYVTCSFNVFVGQSLSRA
jgi:hypothetical protein